MIDGPLKNKTPESIVPVEKGENLESIMKDIENLKSEIESDVVEIGGEDELKKELLKDPKLAERQKILKENILKFIYMFVSGSVGSYFMFNAPPRQSGESLYESLESLVTSNSFLGLCALVSTILVTFSLKEYENKNHKNKAIDQV